MPRRQNTTRQIESRHGSAKLRAHSCIKGINTEWDSHFEKKKIVTRTKLGDFNIFQFAFVRNIYGRINESWPVNQFSIPARGIFRRIIVLNDHYVNIDVGLIINYISPAFNFDETKSGNYTISSI